MCAHTDFTKGLPTSNFRHAIWNVVSLWETRVATLHKDQIIVAEYTWIDIMLIIIKLYETKVSAHPDKNRRICQVKSPELF